jgi:hypothetical protein
MFDGLIVVVWRMKPVTILIISLFKTKIVFVFIKSKSTNRVSIKFGSACLHLILFRTNLL